MSKKDDCFDYGVVYIQTSKLNSIDSQTWHDELAYKLSLKNWQGCAIKGKEDSDGVPFVPKFKYDQLREALEFYAKHFNYQCKEEPNAIDRDGGAIAREALGENCE